MDGTPKVRLFWFKEQIKTFWKLIPQKVTNNNKILREKMKTLKITVISIILLCEVFTGFACKTTTGPELPQVIPPGSRDYTWKIDTIKIPKGYDMLPVRMWAASAKDVWAVGPAYSVVHMIWRFNGESWKTDSIIRNIWPHAVWGASKNDVWIGNLDGAIWHYDGYTITKFCDTKIDSCGDFSINDIYGSSANDIYAVGYAMNLNGRDYKAAIVHYNGTKWENVKIPYLRKCFGSIRYDPVSKEYIIWGLEFESSKETAYRFYGNNVDELLSTIEGCSVNNVGNRVYYTVGQKVYIYENAQLKLLNDFTGTVYGGRVWGRSENDFFTNNRDGIGHYNGTDIVTVWKQWNSDLSLNVGLLIDNDVFFIWQDTRTGETYSVHGILNK